MEFEKYNEIKEKNKQKIEYLVHRNRFLTEQNAMK